MLNLRQREKLYGKPLTFLLSQSIIELKEQGLSYVTVPELRKKILELVKLPNEAFSPSEKIYFTQRIWSIIRELKRNNILTIEKKQTEIKTTYYLIILNPVNDVQP
jgi:hypothetical protein